MTTQFDLRRTVLDELEWEPSINADEIAVTVHDGIVTLTGFASTYAEKLKAEEVVKRVRGVRGIANDIEVRLGGQHERTDTDIARAAVDVLKSRTSVPGDEIKVSVTKGWITLEGNVHWQFQKSAAYESVHHLAGVRGITNLITVKPLVQVGEIKSRIEAAFRRGAEVDSQKVKVETENGKVTLRGDVRSWSEREEAERTAWAAPGVTQVENLILVTSL